MTSIASLVVPSALTGNFDKRSPALDTCTRGTVPMLDNGCMFLSGNSEHPGANKLGMGRLHVFVRPTL